MKHCSHCSFFLEPDVSWCPQCGCIALKEHGENLLECENHSNQRALAVCVVCGKPVCGDCAVAREGKFFCESGKHVTIDGDYAVLYSCESMFEADMIRQNLHQAGIHSLSFSFLDHVGTYWSHDHAHVQLRVTRAQINQATDILRGLGLLHNTDESPLTN